MKKQTSSIHLHNLRDVKINGDTQKLALVKRYIDCIMELGDLEHTGDWDPYLTITVNQFPKLKYLHPELVTAADIDDLKAVNNWEPTGNFPELHHVIYTETGYPEITIGDFNQDDQNLCIRNHEEITNIMVTVPTDNGETAELIIPIKSIFSITLTR